MCSTLNYRDAGPLIEREIYYVIKVHEVLQDKIDTPVPKYCEKEERSSAERPVPVVHDEPHHEHGGSSLVNSWNDCDVCAPSQM